MHLEKQLVAYTPVQDRHEDNGPCIHTCAYKHRFMTVEDGPKVHQCTCYKTTCIAFSCPCGSQLTMGHWGTPCALRLENALAYEGCAILSLWFSSQGHRALGHQKVRPLITVVFSCPCGSQVTISHGGTPCALTSERAPAYEGCERHRAPNAACSNSKEQKAMQRNGTQHTAIQRKQTVTQRIESIAKHHKAT